MRRLLASYPSSSPPPPPPLYRCMFESNFPVDKASCSYTVLWNAFKRIATARGCGEAEMAALFGGTAKRVYNL